MCHQENDMFMLSCSQDVIEKGEKQPNITIGILISVVVVFATVLFRILFGGKKPAVSSSQLFYCPLHPEYEEKLNQQLLVAGSSETCS